MNAKTHVVLIIVLTLLAGVALVTMTWAAPGNALLAPGGAPAMVAYQGEVQVGGAPYTGNGYFKFAIVNATSITYWSNNGSSTGGSEPTAAVQLTVSNGLFSVLLGDTTLGGMTQPLTADVFYQSIRYLRVWFSSDNITFNQLIPDTRITAVPYALQAQEAVEADTVDGLHASELMSHYQNVVIVAQSGGDYTSVQAAIDSISDATADNPYLVWVAPGIYSEMVTMKPYVHLQGAGQEATLITSTASGIDFPPPATLLLANDTSLRDLTVGNGGTGDYNTSLLATAGMTRTLIADVTARAQGSGVSNYAIVLIGDDVGVTLQQVTALAENGDNNFGLVNYSGAQALMRGGTFTARGGSDACGIHNADGTTTLEAESVIALGENGSDNNYGLWNVGAAAATLRGGSFTARGGTSAYGINNDGSDSTLRAETITALAESGSSDNYGLHNLSATAALYGGSFTGRGGIRAYGISNDVGTTLDAEGVTTLGENGSNYNRGLYNVNNSGSVLHGGSFTGRGGANAHGIYNNGGLTTLEAEGVIALGENGSSLNDGLYNYNFATAALYGGSFIGRGGGNAYGIYNYTSATLDAAGITALGENGSGNNAGLYNNAATATVTQGVLDGATASVFRTSGSVTVSNGRLIGGAVAGTVTCVLVTRGTTISTDGSTCP